MAKFYIQSGKVSFVVGAADVEGAALWAMHKTIEKMVEACESEQREIEVAKATFGIESDDMIDPSDSIYEPMLDGLAQFGETIKCSQIGFGRDEASLLQTEQIFRHWRQLMKAADHLFDRLN